MTSCNREQLAESLARALRVCDAEAMDRPSSQKPQTLGSLARLRRHAQAKRHEAGGVSSPAGFAVSLVVISEYSDGLLAGFVGPYPDRFLDGRDEHLAVADLPGLCRLYNGTDSALEKRIGQARLQF